jgi:hypothetical protein
MPHLETWNKLPPAIRQHLMDRLRKAVSSRQKAVGVPPPSLVALTFRSASFCFPRFGLNPIRWFRSASG